MNELIGNVTGPLPFNRGGNVPCFAFMKNQLWIPRAGARGGKGSIVLGF